MDAWLIRVLAWVQFSIPHKPDHPSTEEEEAEDQEFKATLDCESETSLADVTLAAGAWEPKLVPPLT